MKFLHRHWYDISAVIGVITLAILFVFWDDVSVLQRFAIANFAVLMLHVFEEFGFPGGFGKMANTLYFPDSAAPDRYPLNQNMVMVGNWAAAVLFYLPPIFFPQVIWLGLMPMLFGFGIQMLGHGFINNKLLKKAGLRYGYNAGLATALFGHVPLCIAYGIYVERMGLATGWDWVFGIAYTIFGYAIIFRKLIMKPLEDKNSPYPFDAVEMARFDRLYRR